MSQDPIITITEAELDHLVPLGNNEFMDEEGRVEAHRRDGVACYSMTRHIELLIALMAEAAALGQSHRPV